MKKYRIIVLGASGAGKTVYLASLFKHLSVFSSEIGFTLETNGAQRRRLINLYSEIADPELDWPPGTKRSEISTWDFVCNVKSNHGDAFSVLEFSYLDYAGELLTHDGFEESNEIEEQAEKADALLVLLDGYRILKLMENQSGAYAFLDNELSHILAMIEGIPLVPVQFVITKWDLLDSLNYSLDEIKHELMTFKHFNEFVTHRKNYPIKTPMRLIPVSALGSEFTKFDSGKGRIMKIPGGRPQPFQVEIPLACVLPDQFATTQLRIEQQKGSIRYMLSKLSIEILWVVAILVNFLKLFAWVPVAGVLFQMTDMLTDKGLDALKEAHRKSQIKIDNMASAIKSVVLSHEILIAELESKFPASNLND